MMKKGIAIIGLDHWYQAYGCAYSITVNPKVELIAICDANEEKAKKMANIYGAKRYYKDYNKLLEGPEVDVVIITTTPDMHDEVALAATTAG